jgi:hypothetical protein
MKDLQTSLRDHSMAMLRVIAELNGTELATNARDDASVQLADALRAGEAVADALRRCSPGARAAWRALATAGGRMKVPAFARLYGALRPVGPGKLERDMPWRDPANPAEELWYWGLIYRGFADSGNGPAEYFYIPDDLQTQGTEESASRTPPVKAALLPVDLSPTQGHRAWPLAIDACNLLADLSDSPLRIDTTGHLRGSDEVRLREALLLQEPIRFAMLLSLAKDLGWLESEDTEGRLSVRSDPVGEWLRADPWEQQTALFSAWRESTDWNDLRRMPSVRAEGEWRNDPRLARRAIIAALAGLVPGAWYSIADLVRWQKQIDPDFQRPDGNYAGWYLRDTATGRYLSGFESWDEVEGRLIYYIISEPLFWLGALELGVAGEERRELFRLLPAGAAWICGSGAPEPPPLAQLLAGDDFSITVPLAVPLVDRYRLLRFTERVQEVPQPGQPTRHRITRRSLARARSSGLQAGRIVQFLRHATGGQIPDRVVVALERWQRHGGSVRVTRGAVLRVEDASILATLRADPSLAPLLGDLLSAQAVLVPSASLPRLLSALAELGYATKIDG